MGCGDGVSFRWYCSVGGLIMGAPRGHMTRWYEPVSARGQDLLRGHGGADRGQGGRYAPDRGAPGLTIRGRQIGRMPLAIYTVLMFDERGQAGESI